MYGCLYRLLEPFCPAHLISAVVAALALSLTLMAAEPDRNENRLIFKYHSPPATAPPSMQDQARYDLPSLLVADDGSSITTPSDWYSRRRPELVRHWTHILGKLRPDASDAKWFGDVRQTVVDSSEPRDGYRRMQVKIPIETDFWQPHLLLLPEGQGRGPFPAVIAWTSTSPDYQQPETWWGAWLARHGYVVLTGWSFIRNYRGGADYSRNVNQVVYDRFGHWLPMAKMVHDVQREVEYLRTRPEVDSRRIGFMGFSLSAKAALYVAAFAKDVQAIVAIDPHLALYGATNYQDPWYLDWQHKFSDISTPNYPVAELRGSVWSLLDTDPKRPGFERNHHELMAMCAPRALMVIGCSTDQQVATHSDDRQSIGYVNRAREVYQLLGLAERFQYVALDGGHRATGPHIDAAWQGFFQRWLKDDPVAGYLPGE